MDLMLTIALVYGVSYVIAPFPYWPTYWALWKKVLTSHPQKFGLRTKWLEARFLLGYALLNPLWTLFWYIDEVFYAGYKNMPVRPVFIIGSPRSGTTFMHRALAADTETFFAIRHIEWRYPFISLQKIFQHSKLADKIAHSNYWSDTPAGQLAAKMHPNTLDDWEEDGIFFEECFLQHLYTVLRFPYPELIDSLDDFDGLPAAAQQRLMDAHKKAIQKVMYLQGAETKYYLSKEVAGHNKLGHLLQMYPDAKFIVATRHPSEFIPSLMELLRVSIMSKTGVDTKTDAPEFDRAFIERMRLDGIKVVEWCDGDNPKIPRDRQVRMTFNHFSSDIQAAVKYIYQAFGLVVNDAHLQHLAQLQQSQKQRDRGYDYQKNDDLGFVEFDAFVTKIEAELNDALRKTGA